MLKRQEKKIKEVGDYAGSIQPPKFDMDKPAPYPYDKFSRGGLARAGWKPATKPEWRAWFENHTVTTYIPLIRHTLQAHFAEGVNYGKDGNPLYTVEGAIDAFFIETRSPQSSTVASWTTPSIILLTSRRGVLIRRRRTRTEAIEISRSIFGVESGPARRRRRRACADTPCARRAPT